MARTSSASASKTPTRVVNCLKTGTPEALEKVFQELGTDFLRSKRSINVHDLDTPVLAYFCFKNNHECAKKVVELDPECNLDSALKLSIIGGLLENVKLVLEAHRKRGHTPEDVALAQGLGGLRMIVYASQVTLDILREVCEHDQVGLGEFVFAGQSVVKDRFINKTPLDMAMKGDIVDYLCQRWKQDPNNGEKETECDRPRPLHQAVLRTNADVVERLVANGAHVQAQTVNGTPVVGKAIHLLCANTTMPSQHILRSLRCLVANGADPSAPSLMARHKPLAIALEKKNDVAVEFLVIEAKVDATQELATFVSDQIATKLLNEAKAKRDLGLTIVELVEETSKRHLSDTVELFPWDDGIRSEQCRLLSDTYELTSQPEPCLSMNLATKAETVARCLLGETLNSDGSYSWLAFWAAPDSTKRAARRVTEQSKVSTTLLYALGTDSHQHKNLKVVEAKSKDVFLSNLGWEDVEDDEECDIDVTKLTAAEALKLDRGDRVHLLKKAFGDGTKVFWARFENAVSHPICLLAVDESTGAIFGCLSTRVDT